MMADEIQFTQEETQIYSCLNLDNPKSFFLFAGAGSGKTRSLVQVLKQFKIDNGNKLKLKGQKIAIITYTNAASDEIKRRLEFDSTFVVSTIHSFSWELIKPYQQDIRKWLEENLHTEIVDLEEQQRKGRLGTKTAIDREAKIISKKRRLESLNSIKKFSYNPNGTNSSRDSLNHAEVIKITSDFIMTKTLMQKIIVKKYPILLIDESQDTKKELMESFFIVQEHHSNCFSLGLFGDTMQRIYMDGKADLGINIPENWEKPAKVINYRCPSRVITLINKIRASVDDQKQIPYKQQEGFVRLFIVDSNSLLDKSRIESIISQKMVEITSDEKWGILREEVKCLTLEHHMAANRSGFLNFFEPLYKSTNDSTGLLDGSMHGISFLIKQVLPLIKAKKEKDEFAVANIIKSYSPLLNREILHSSTNQLAEIKNAELAVNTLLSLWGDRFQNNPTLDAILRSISKLRIFILPEILSLIINRDNVKIVDNNEADIKQDELIEAWEEALKAPFNQLELYNDYISDNSSFGTHQGVKGLEFPRVMVILDDDEARGFLFSYEKLLEAKELSTTDNKNRSEGNETTIDRTRRLFYVTCSRAEESLAIVAYTKNPKAIRTFAISQSWFEEEEIVQFDKIEND